MPVCAVQLRLWRNDARLQQTTQQNTNWYLANEQQITPILKFDSNTDKCRTLPTNWSNTSVRCRDGG